MEQYEMDRRDNKLRLDKSINLGNILTLVVVLFSLIQMYNGIMNRMITMENKVDLMWSQFAITMRNK